MQQLLPTIKLICLKAAKELGIPTAKSVTLTTPTATVMDRIVAEIGFPVL